MSLRVLLLLLGAVVLVLDGALALIVIRGSRLEALPVVVGGALLGLGASLAGLRLARKGVDWERIRCEQRLWESGPLGRAWLRERQRLLDRADRR